MQRGCICSEIQKADIYAQEDHSKKTIGIYWLCMIMHPALINTAQKTDLVTIYLSTYDLYNTKNGKYKNISHIIFTSILNWCFIDICIIEFPEHYGWAWH